MKRQHGGFSIIELLAALVAGVVVLGAGTGFMVTVIARQNAVFKSTSLEERHDDLAMRLSSSVKMSTKYQIFASLPAVRSDQLGAGVAAGNCLICLRNGTREEYVFDGAVITCNQVVGDREEKKNYPGATSAGPLFSADLGVVQARWTLITDLETVPYDVCAVPLYLR